MRNQEYKAAQKNKFGGIYKNNAPPKRHSIRIRYIVLVILVLLSTVTFYLHIEGDNNTLHINEFLRGAKAAKDIAHQYSVSEQKNYNEDKNIPISEQMIKEKNIPPVIKNKSLSTKKEKRTYRVKSPIITKTTDPINLTNAPTSAVVSYLVPETRGERTDQRTVRTDVVIVPTVTATAEPTAQPTATPTAAKITIIAESESKHIVPTEPELLIPSVDPVNLPHTEGAGYVPLNIIPSDTRLDPSVNHNLRPVFTGKEEKMEVKGEKEDHVELPLPQHIDIELPVPLDPPVHNDLPMHIEVPVSHDLPVTQDVVAEPVNDVTPIIPAVVDVSPIIPSIPVIPIAPIIPVLPVVPVLPVGVPVVAGGVGSNAAVKGKLDDHYSENDEKNSSSSSSSSSHNGKLISHSSSSSSVDVSHDASKVVSKDIPPIHEISIESVIPTDVTVKKTDATRHIPIIPVPPSVHKHHVAHVEVKEAVKDEDEVKAEAKSDKVTEKVAEKVADKKDEKVVEKSAHDFTRRESKKVTTKVADKVDARFTDKVTDANPVAVAPVVPVVPPVVIPLAPLTVLKESVKEHVKEPLTEHVKESAKEHSDRVKESIREHDAKELGLKISAEKVTPSKIDAVKRQDTKHREHIDNTEITGSTEHSRVIEEKILSESNVKSNEGISTAEEMLIKESVMKLMQKKIDAVKKLSRDHLEDTETTENSTKNTEKNTKISEETSEVTEKKPIIDHNVGIRGQKQDIIEDPTPQEGHETVNSESVKAATVKTVKVEKIEIGNSKPLDHEAPIIPIRNPVLPNQVSEVIIPIIEKEKEEKKRVIIPEKKQFSSARISEPIVQGQGHGEGQEEEEKFVVEIKTRPGAHVAAVVDRSTGGVSGSGAGGGGGVGVSTGNVNSIACSGTMDPFAGQPVDTFKPPVNAELTLKRQWTTAVSDMLTRISRMRVGGEKLRLLIKDEIVVLQLLRIQLFCKYA